MGLLSRALQNAGIAPTITTWHFATKLTAPPRLAVTRMERGATLGTPHHPAQQRRILERTLALLEEDAPVEPIRLKERWRSDN